MKKIVFAVTTDLNYDQRMQRICTSLATSGYKVLLIGREWKYSQPLRPQPYDQHRLKCFFAKGKLFYLEFTLRLWICLFFKCFDAFRAIDLVTILPVFLKAKLANKPFIYDAHEYFTEVVEVVNRPVIKKVWTKLEAFVLSRTQYAYTVNESLARLYFSKYQLPFAVIRNCSVLDPDFNGPPCKNEKYLLYQGAVNEGRGLEALIEAMQFVTMKLVICGKGDVFKKIQRLTESLNLNDKIIFKGFLIPDELKQITQKAFLGINLLENKGLNYYYFLGNKFFDYSHAGIPQVMVDFPEYSYLNNQYQVGTTVNLQPEAIATAINTFIQDPDYYNRFVQNCLKAQTELSWQKEEEKLLAFYKNVWQ